MDALINFKKNIECLYCASIVRFCAYLIPQRLAPIWLSLASCLAGIIAAIFVVLQTTWPAVICLLLSGLLDTLDGHHARKIGKSSTQGATADIICDRIVEFCMIFAIAQYNLAARASYAFVILGLFYLCITSFLLAGIFSQDPSKQKSFHYHRGLIERLETFIFFILVILLPNFFKPLAIIFSLLLALTIYQHLRYIIDRASPKL